MAEKKKSKSNALALLTPNSFVVTLNGETITVAGDKNENAILNMFLAARLRNTLEKHMDTYKADEKILSPKELRDLAGAARDIAAFSAEVYATQDPISPNTEKKADATTDDDPIIFEELSKPPEVITKNEQPT